MTVTPKITVLIRTYNSEGTILEALESLFRQTLPSKFYEVLVVDDGSTDQTLSLLKRYEGRIRILKQAHRGPIRAVNYGIRNGLGKYVIQLDSDDLFAPTILEEMCSVVQKDASLDFVYSDYYEQNLGETGASRISTERNIFNTVAMGILFKKLWIEKANGYDESLVFPEYDLILKTEKRTKSRHIPRALFTYRRHKGSITADQKRVAKGLRQLAVKYGRTIPVRNYSDKPKIAYIGCRQMGYECLEFLMRHHPENLAAVYTLHEDLAHTVAGFRSFDPLFQTSLVPFHKVHDINDPQWVKSLQEFNPDLIVQVAWSQIIKPRILSIPALGCIGFHSSLLPKDRGGSPVNWALIRSEKEWGITLMVLDPGIDNGDIVAQRKFKISLRDTNKTVYEKATKAAIQLLKKYLPALLKGNAPRVQQDETKATRNKRRTPEEGLIDWNRTSMEIYNWIRALTHPYPGAFTYFQGKKISVWKASLPGKNWKREYNGDVKPGMIIKTLPSGRLLVKTKDDVLLVERIQRENEMEINASKWEIRSEGHECFDNSRSPG